MLDCNVCRRNSEWYLIMFMFRIWILLCLYIFFFKKLSETSTVEGAPMDHQLIPIEKFVFKLRVHFKWFRSLF